MKLLTDNWPDRVLAMQRNWIGRSEGAEVDFHVADADLPPVRIFTTRIDTIYGATCLIVAPEHPLAGGMDDPRAKAMIDARANQGMGEVEKEGYFTGHYATNPFSKERMPIWTGNFVLMGYGTGAIMAVPGHDERDFEFCQKYKLPIRSVVRPVVIENAGGLSSPINLTEAFCDYGIVEHSGKWSGETSAEARRQMTRFAEEQTFGKGAITFRLKDWGISRQRYWGTPIPVIHCPVDGPIPVPEQDLPVRLPEKIEITGEGRSPLENVPDFVNVACPKCGQPARRETDTMDTFVDSSWYFYRYCDPHNANAPFDAAVIAHWFPIDQYIGGVEHAILHLIYSRFWTKMMRDIGVISNEEPVRKLFTQGMVIRNNEKMSKSRGNVVPADEVSDKYGADAARLFALFAAPPEKDVDWIDSGIEGIVRFLGRVFRFATRNIPAQATDGTADTAILRKLHQTLRKITEDFDSRWHFNTSIAALMELLNDLYANEQHISAPAMAQAIEIITLILAPFAPYMAQELWAEQGNTTPVFKHPWPVYNEELTKEQELEVVLQVNGKNRSKLTVAPGTGREELEQMAMSDERITTLMAGKILVRVIVVPDKLVNIVIR